MSLCASWLVYVREGLVESGWITVVLGFTCLYQGV